MERKDGRERVREGEEEGGEREGGEERAKLITNSTGIHKEKRVNK